jgi:formate hydrogenlyase subunit 3/multisubunit Na+/H+ antiporter MnhD subunit
VSLAAYVLVIHDASDKALRAGRVYIVLAVLAEACLLLAFVIGIGRGRQHRSPMSARPCPPARWVDWPPLLLVAGFGMKAGLLPLHVWLPLAHPAAPTPPRRSCRARS